MRDRVKVMNGKRQERLGKIARGDAGRKMYGR